MDVKQQRAYRKLLKSINDKIGKSVKGLERDVLTQIIKDVLKTINFDETDLTKLSLDFTKVVKKIQASFRKLWKKSKISKELFKGIKRTNDLTKAYFKVAFPDKDLSVFKEFLPDVDLNTDLERKIIQTVSNSVYGTRNKEKLVKDLEGASSRRITNRLEDAVIKSSRETTVDAAAKLNIGFYWIFNGTKRANSRAWCAAKKGKVYSADEVVAWYLETWDGKRKKDTKNFKLDEYDPFIDLGDFECVDNLAPTPYTFAKSMRSNIKSPDAVRAALEKQLKDSRLKNMHKRIKSLL